MEPDRLQFLTAAIESLMAQDRLDEAEALAGTVDSPMITSTTRPCITCMAQLMVMRGQTVTEALFVLRDGELAGSG